MRCETAPKCCKKKSPEKASFDPKSRAVLLALGQAQGPMGRKQIASHTEENGCLLSEQEVRHVRKHLEEQGLLFISRGRSGSRLTEKGKELVRKLVK